MYALYFTNVLGTKHTLFFKTREERAHFMNDPATYMIAKCYRTPVEQEMCDPVSENEEVVAKNEHSRK